MGMTNEELDALEVELAELEYADAEWTQADLDRQAVIYRLLAENGRG